MANPAPTQQLPPWMTLSTAVFTDAEGSLTTSITTLQLPLTYYGPSIPLGTDGAWTYGGLTSPAPSSSTPSTATSPTATPPSSSPTSSFASSTSPPSPTSPPYPYSNSTSLSKGALIGIIFGAVCGFILFLLLLICFVRWRARRRRDSGYQSSHNTTPIWTGWEVVSPTNPQFTQEERHPGEGSPRGSGEEADSFLQRSASATAVDSPAARDDEPTVRLGSALAPLPPGAAAPRPPGVTATASLGTGTSQRTHSTATTDYGVIQLNTGRTGANVDFDLGYPARPSSEMMGHIVPPRELMRMDSEREREEMQAAPRMYHVPRSSDPTLPEHYSPLIPPPLIDLDRLPSRKPSDKSLMVEKEKSTRTLSYPASELEDSKILTARRVRIGQQSAFDDESSAHTYGEPIAGPSSWRNSFRSSFARLGQAIFTSSSSRSNSNSRSRPSSSMGREQDMEAGQSLLGAGSRTRRGLGLGLTVEGDRPMSSVSAKSAISGNSVYHDAVSRMGTPVSVPSRAMTPASPRGNGNGNGNGGGGDFAPPMPPPAYDDPYDSIGSRLSAGAPQGIDILDLPAPPPISPFSGAATSRAHMPFPPGLVPLPSPRAWRDSLSVITGSSNDAAMSLSTDPGISFEGAGISIDVLDAEPPRAGEGWRTLASTLGPGTSERRTTFGVPQVVHPGAPMLSERGSLHSMRSHLSPYSARSSGSAPTSSRRAFGASNGSNSSRPSAQSRLMNSSNASLRSGSVSSHGGLRSVNSGPISPALSAFGHAGDIDEVNGDGNRVSVLGPMPSFTSRSAFAPTVRSVGAVSVGGTSVTATLTSEDTVFTRTTTTVGGGEEEADRERESQGMLRFPSVPFYDTFGGRPDLL